MIYKIKRDAERETRAQLLAMVADIMEEITRSGPHHVSPEWFTLDLTMPQVRAIFVLLQKGQQRMNNLATTMAISFSRATSLVDQLVEKGLVERWTDPEDRRSVLCDLTQQGKDLAQRLLLERRSRWEERMAPLSVEELQKVCQAMELVRDAARSSRHVEGPATSRAIGE